MTSGSDEGNFFVWHKSTGALHGIYEGDSSVVNVIEGHPYLPLVAVSGIDTTIKASAVSITILARLTWYSCLRPLLVLASFRGWTTLLASWKQMRVRVGPGG